MLALKPGRGSLRSRATLLRAWLKHASESAAEARSLLRDQMHMKYELTGGTGSYKYMAPEVYMCKLANEKARCAACAVPSPLVIPPAHTRAAHSKSCLRCAAAGLSRVMLPRRA